MPKTREPFLQLDGNNQFFSSKLLELIYITLRQRICGIIGIATVPIDAGRDSESDCQDNHGHEPEHPLMMTSSRLKGAHTPNDQAQRRWTRGAAIATATTRRRSLQRMARRAIVHGVAQRA